LPLARLLPEVKGSAYGIAAHKRPNLIAHPRDKTLGRVTPLAGKHHQPAAGDAGIVKGKGVSIGSFSPPAGGMGIDKARVSFSQHLVANAHPVGGVYAQIIDEDISPVNQLKENLKPLFLL
jgi:hypothetical protein